MGDYNHDGAENSQDIRDWLKGDTPIEQPKTNNKSDLPHVTVSDPGRFEKEEKLQATKQPIDRSLGTVSSSSDDNGELGATGENGAPGAVGAQYGYSL